MADTRLLLDGLRDYHAGLTSELGRLQEDWQNLEVVHQALDQVFQGDAAEQFRQSWLRTAERFRAYLEQAALLAQGLESRFTDLENANTAGKDLLG